MEIRQVTLTKDIETVLINFSQEWEKENSCYGYKANNSCDLEGRTILMAYEDNMPIGYLFGLYETTEKDTFTIPKGCQTFEIEEIYVKKNFRSMGVGQKLFRSLEEIIEDKVDYLTLTTATKN